jgi:hypothetical protein
MLKVKLAYSEDTLGKALFGRYDLKSKDPSIFGNPALKALDMMSQQLPCKPMQDIGGSVNSRMKQTNIIPNLSGIRAPVISGRLINFGLNYSADEVRNAGQPILRHPSNFNVNMKSKLPAPK